MPVTATQITKAKATTAGASMQNIEVLAAVCNQLVYPFHFGLAIMEKESGGKNVYGNDKGGAMAGWKGEVNEENYKLFRWLVDTGVTIANSDGTTSVIKMNSNGVGPFQITFSGFFPQMEAQALKPWVVRDNIQFGLQELQKSFNTNRRSMDVENAFWNSAKAYNGLASYADDAVVKAKAWATAVGTTDTAISF